MTSLFKSYWQAGFECSTHVLKSGKRLDLVASTRHDLLVNEDYERCKAIGIRTAREGFRWHLIEAERGQYDFSSAKPMVEAAQRQGMQVIWDMLHFGWPDHVRVFEASFVDAFGEFASQIGRLLKQETSEQAFVAPVNEISFLSWAGGDTQYLNPYEQGRGAEFKRQLVRAYIRAAQAIRAELPDSRLVSPEPVIHIAGDPARPDDVRQAAEYRSSMFEAWDMMSGRTHPDLDGEEEYLDIIGINYYDRNQWWNYGKTIWRNDPDYRPFREILAEVYTRYRRPMFISETGTEDSDRPHWLAYVANEVQEASRQGVSLHGICIYPILNHPGWDDDRHCYNGLWDYSLPDGSREIYQPLAAELERLRDNGK